MTLDEAIKIHEKNAEYALKATQTDLPSKKMHEEHRQLAEWLRDYKRLKEQEPCEDCISRQEVIENAFSIYTHECGIVDVVGVATIKELPSVKPQLQTGWNLCSEREPEEDGRYRVYTWSHKITTAQYIDGYWNIKTPILAWMQIESDIKQGLNYADEDTLMPAT